MNDCLFLPVEIAGIEFKNPFYVASGPTTRTVEQLLAIEKAGWAAASIKLSIDPPPYINRHPRYSLFKQYDALGFTAEKRLTYDQGRLVISEAKKKLNDLVLMANIAYSGEKGAQGWVDMALGFEDAGADMIELNMCCPNMSFNVQVTSGDKDVINQRTGASIGQDEEVVTEVVGAIKSKLTVPLIVKLTPEYGGIGSVAKAAYLAGADAVSGTAGRLGIPPIDLEHPEKSTFHLQDEVGMVCLCGAWIKPLALRDTYEIRLACGPETPIFATGGVRNAHDALETAMCGGDMIGICTETLIRGYNFIGDIVAETKKWLVSHGYKNLNDIRDRIVPAVKSAPELTLWRGHAKVVKPDLIAPCRAVCPKGIDIQAVLKKISQGDKLRAYQLAAGSEACEGCSAPCEKSCVRGRADGALSIKKILTNLRADAKIKGVDITMCAEDNHKDRAVSKAADVLSNRSIRNIGVFPDASSWLEESASRCLKCGCGEGCATCSEICCEFAVTINEQSRIAIDSSRCVACGMCFNCCPNKNIQMFNTGETL